MFSPLLKNIHVVLPTNSSLSFAQALCRSFSRCALLACRRLQKVGFFPKSVKKSVKRGVRVLRARGARASHARRACEARENF